MAEKKTDPLADLIPKLGEHLEGLDKLSNEEIAAIIGTLSQNPDVWNKMPSGNRDYLQKALDAYQKDPNAATKYLKGAIPHLKKAWPHMAGFIASKGEHEKTGELNFDAVLNGEKDLTDMKGEELIQFAKYVEGHSSLASLRAYKGSRTAVQSILGKYEKLVKEGKAEDAAKYAEEKKGSLSNIYKKSYLPNLSGAIARGEVRL